MIWLYLYTYYYYYLHTVPLAQICRVPKKHLLSRWHGAGWWFIQLNKNKIIANRIENYYVSAFWPEFLQLPWFRWILRFWGWIIHRIVFNLTGFWDFKAGLLSENFTHNSSFWSLLAWRRLRKSLLRRLRFKMTLILFFSFFKTFKPKVGK